jgi:recombination protein U
MADRKNMGKVFEKEFKDSLPSDWYTERYKDDTSGFYGVSNPADFRLYCYPVLLLLELKTHKGKSLPLAKIRDSQLKGMLKAVNHYGVYGGFLVNFRDLEETYFLSVGYVENFVKSGERKSIPVEFFREYGIRIPQTKKRTLYRYDFTEWLRRYVDDLQD